MDIGAVIDNSFSAAVGVDAVIYALAAVGLLRTQQLIAQWRIAIVVIAVIAAAITPTTDPINMGLVMAPMVLLYLVSILAAAAAGGGTKAARTK